MPVSLIDDCTYLTKANSKLPLMTTKSGMCQVSGAIYANFISLCLHPSVAICQLEMPPNRKLKRSYLQACIQEEDPDTAFALLFRFHPYADQVEPSVRELFYNKTLMLCTQSEFSRLIQLAALGCSCVINLRYFAQTLLV